MTGYIHEAMEHQFTNSQISFVAADTYYSTEQHHIKMLAQVLETGESRARVEFMQQ